jgi:CelD/BcsL family acetyltransferase involved in cellulose biosynthesis
LSERAAALDHVPAGWDSLLAADPSGSPSHRPEVWAALAAAIPGFEWRLLTHRQDGALVAGAPLVISRRGPFRWLHALPWLLPAPPLARPGAHAIGDRAIASAVAAFAREQRVVGGEWSLYRPDGPAPDEAMLASVPGETRWFEAALLRLDHGLEPVLKRMSRKQRQALDHARARGYAFAEEPDALDEAHALHLSQSHAWGPHRPLPLDLSRRLLAAGGSEPSARLYTLRGRHGLVSATLALEGPHETFVWWSGTHAEGRRANAFAWLLWCVGERAAARGRRRLNLGASTDLPHVAAFKASLGAEVFRYPVRRLDARAAGVAGRAIGALQSLVRRGRPQGERR